MLGLLSVWTGELEWKSDNDFIWELVDNKQDLNIPILVCEDECDLNCIVIMVHARFTEAYTDEDWKKCGSNIASEKSNTME